MFPFDIEENEIVEDEQVPKKEYEVDFEAGKLTGKAISGLDAVLQWARIVLSTDRYFYTQYTWNHGFEGNTLIGKGNNTDYIESELKRMIQEALSVNEDITAVEINDMNITDEKLSAKIKISTVFGEGEINV